jgi:hypothetical protein
MTKPSPYSLLPVPCISNLFCDAAFEFEASKNRGLQSVKANRKPLPLSGNNSA